LEEVDFIKIDVQGADGEVLLGGVETLRRCRPVVVFEWEEALSKNFGVTFQSLKQTFYREGYKLELLHQHNDKQSDFIALPV
jgi:methyltransferase FkbM-like protein